MSDVTEYQVLAACFAHPDEGLFEGLKSLPEFRETLKDASLDDLRKEHVRLLTPTVAGGLPPYETEYGKGEIFAKTRDLADIAGFYRAFGLDIAESAHERVDFIAAELEFMHWLVLKEERAQEKGDEANASLCREAQKDFLQDHLGRWAAYFGDRLAANSRHPFYALLGRRLSGFVSSECRRLGAGPEAVSGRAPEDPSEDLSCGKE
jgi:TorA maturation chaperone TorD